MANAGALNSTSTQLAAADVTQDASMTALSFGSGWGNYGFEYATAGYKVDQFGILRLRGLVARTSGSNTTIATLSGIEVASRTLFGSYATGAMGRIDLIPTGANSTNIALWGGSATFVQLDRISMDVRDPGASTSAWGTQSSASTIDAERIVRESWTNLPLSTGYVYWGSPYYVPAYRKDPMGIVHLRGLAKMNTKTALPVVIATLPSGYRPVSKKVLLTNESNGAWADFVIATDGTITWAGGSPADNAHIGLDGLSFDAGTSAGSTLGSILNTASLPSSLMSGIEGWTTATLQNSWVHYSSGAGADTSYYDASYRKDQYGRVYLRGVVKNGTGIAFPGSPIFTLPSGYRPSRRRLFAVSSNGAVGRIDVAGTDSDITPGAVTCVQGSNAWVSLDGIWFDT